MQPPKKPTLPVDQWVTDGMALEGERSHSRRSFLRNASALSVLSGFALAAHPIHAQQLVRTDSLGLKASQITIDAQGSLLPLYVAQPESASGPLPLIIVVSEIFGVHEHIADVARRFAKLGYMAIAPDFFHRAGDPSKLASNADIFKQIISKTADAQVQQDINATLQWAGQHGADLKRAGITGFCWGGRITWLACAASAQFKAGVAWYGRLTGDQNDMTPQHPVDVAAKLQAPVLGLYGGQDTGIPSETVKQMQQALLAAHTNPMADASRIEVFPEAPHAFHADYRPSYREAEARHAWQQCLKWFKQHGV